MKLTFFLSRATVFSVALSILVISCNARGGSAKTEKPVTAEEGKQFAKQLQSSIEKRSEDFFNNAIDKETFLTKAGLDSDKESRQFGSGIDQGMKMGTSMVTGLSKKATYELVKQYEKDGKQHVLFRMYDNGSLNYHDIELIRSGGEVKVADIFVYTTGEFLTETIKGLYDQMKSATGGKLKGSDEDWIRQIPEMRKLVTQNKHDEALALYEQMPQKVKNMRAVQLMHVVICSGLPDEQQYNAAIEEYKTLYPNEPNMHLLLLDGYIINKEYDKALYGINEMDKMINKDPFLDYYRYLCYNLKEDKDSARISLVRLMENKPDFEDGMLELIAQHIADKKYELADEWIGKFRTRSSFDQETLNQYLSSVDYTPKQK